MGDFLLHNHATFWSKLQDCKISSRAEIPKLDRVWQLYETAQYIQSDEHMGHRAQDGKKVAEMSLFKKKV